MVRYPPAITGREYAMAIKVTDIENPEYLTEPPNVGWSGTVHMTAETDMGELNFRVSFSSCPTIEEGIKSAKKKLATVAHNLAREAEGE
jgi:hypothetical protein